MLLLIPIEYIQYLWIIPTIFCLQETQVLLLDISWKISLFWFLNRACTYFKLGQSFVNWLFQCKVSTLWSLDCYSEIWNFCQRTFLSTERYNLTLRLGNFFKYMWQVECLGRTGPLACLSPFPVWCWIRSDYSACLRCSAPVNVVQIYCIRKLCCINPWHNNHGFPDANLSVTYIIVSTCCVELQWIFSISVCTPSNTKQEIAKQEYVSTFANLF